MRPRKILHADFDEKHENAFRERIAQNNITLYKTFATPEGRKTLEILQEIVSGPLVGPSDSQTIANSARRDLVDEIMIAINKGEEELNG